MNVLEVLEKMKDITGSTDGLTLSINVNVELDEGQYNELIKTLNSMGYMFYDKGIDSQGLLVEIYHNNNTGESISINHTKGEKYKIKYIIYYHGNNEVHS